MFITPGFEGFERWEAGIISEQARSRDEGRADEVAEALCEFFSKRLAGAFRVIAAFVVFGEATEALNRWA